MNRLTIVLVVAALFMLGFSAGFYIQQGFIDDFQELLDTRTEQVMECVQTSDEALDLAEACAADLQETVSKVIYDQVAEELLACKFDREMNPEGVPYPDDWTESYCEALRFEEMQVLIESDYDMALLAHEFVSRSYALVDCIQYDPDFVGDQVLWMSEALHALDILESWLAPETKPSGG